MRHLSHFRDIYLTVFAPSCILFWDTFHDQNCSRSRFYIRIAFYPPPRFSLFFLSLSHYFIYSRLRYLECFPYLDYEDPLRLEEKP
jgi:hypothetical protein